jgi:hypothetical protein
MAGRSKHGYMKARQQLARRASGGVYGQSLDKAQSAKQFSGDVAKSHAKNVGVAAPMRGGWRL